MAAHPKITPDKVEQVIAALRIGADIAGAAHLISVSTSGLERYMVRHPLVKVRADEARKIADDRVQSALYKSAVGGNVTAMIFWLKNRQSAEWRDRRELAGVPDAPLLPGPIRVVFDDALDEDEAPDEPGSDG